MEQRTLGDTGLRATVLGYGAMELGDPERVSDSQAEHMLGAVLDGGINFVDTSPDYGVSEDRIGAYLSHRRSEYVLATKGGCNVDAHGRGGDPRHVWTREQLLANIEQSLRRLRTDHVDIWQLHNAPVEAVDGAALLEVMHEVQATGKVRHVSISSTLPDLAAYLERRAFATYQIPYSALQREHETVIGEAAAAGAGVIIRGGVAKGEHSSRQSDRWALWETCKLDEFLADGESRSSFLLRLTITHPGMHTTIVGTRNPQHLADNLAAAERGTVPEDTYAEIKRRLTEAGEHP
jgi:aryl-alcohol dehydrogenase-like predicted oxidoreductase